MKKYWGNSLGIVIQNNDPDRSGKVKVFVPHISPTVYQKWIQQKTNKSFKFLGNNIQSILTVLLDGNTTRIDNTIINVAEELKRILPWAECACPLVGENTSGRYNATRQIGTTSDSNFAEDLNANISSSDIPGKPAAFFEKSDYRLTDAFTSAAENVNRPNPFSYEYIPSSYSNKAKGSFAVPAVGSHVWVFFREGNPTSPVYFATTFGTIDWQGIFNSENGGLDYPNTFENKIETSYTNNVDTYRNKYVINQKGGTFEIVNTDLNEKLKLTHFSGSFTEFNNQANIELAVKNSQKLVLNDQYETVRGFKNEYVGKSLDEIILRDKFKKVGKLDSDLFDRWKETYAIIHENKQLFEIKRTTNQNVLDEDGNIRLKRNSLLQTRSGDFANHPVTSNTPQLTVDSTQTIAAYNTTSNSSTDTPQTINSLLGSVVAKQFPPVNRYLAESNTTWGEGGVGKSTSTQDGVWDKEEQKDLLKTLIELNLQELTEIEKELGIGGSEVVHIAKHKIETIGATINDFGSIRYDGIGKMLSNEVLVDEQGVYLNKKESPLIELVHVQDLPGGNYTLNISNRFNVLVGAGGVNFKSLGPVNLVGTVTNIAGEQVNIATQNELNLDAKTINISAEILRLRSKNQRQILINDSLGVNNNLVVGGGMHVEGEMFVQHITAPKEFQVTEQSTVFGKFVVGGTCQIRINGGTVATLEFVSTGENIVECYPHSHMFANIPLTLVDSNAGVRTLAKQLNSGDTRILASPIRNQRK
jgi:hypothetical protein